MTGTRCRASVSRSARYASRVSWLTRQTPFLPILSAGRSPERISVYTWVTVTFNTRATSAGLSSGGGRSVIQKFPNRHGEPSLGLHSMQFGAFAEPSVPFGARAMASGRS